MYSILHRQRDRQIDQQRNKRWCKPPAPSGIISERGPFRYPLGWAKFWHQIRTGGDMSQRKQTHIRREREREALISPLHGPSKPTLTSRAMRRSTSSQSQIRGIPLGRAWGNWSIFYKAQLAVRCRGGGGCVNTAFQACRLLLCSMLQGRARQKET